MGKYRIIGGYNDEDDRRYVKSQIQMRTNWKVINPENKKLSCCDLIVTRGDGKEISIEIERYRKDVDIERAFYDFTIPQRKLNGIGIFVKLSYDRTQCWSVPFETFRKEAHGSREDCQSLKPFPAIDADNVHIHKGYDELVDLIRLF